MCKLLGIMMVKKHLVVNKLGSHPQNRGLRPIVMDSGEEAVYGN